MAYQYRGKIRDLTEPVAQLFPPASRKRSKFDPTKCGTRAGYRQHQNHDVDVCDRCQAANAEYMRRYNEGRQNNPNRVIRKGFNPDACGTAAGFHRHRRHGVPACDPCRKANTEYLDGWRKARRAA